MKLEFNAGKNQRALFYAVTFVILLLDQVSKYFAQSSLRGQSAIIYWNDFFRFDYAENPGAFLGMGDSLSDPFRFWIFTILVFFLMLGLAIYIHVRNIPRAEAWAYSLVFAGGMGNLLDRAWRPQGHVIDFMNMGFGHLRTGIFNIADVAIMAGLVLLLFLPGKKKSA